MGILYTFGICLYCLVWAPLAFLKDAVCLIAVPFDTQRCINTYVQLMKNAKVLMYINESTPEQPNPQQEVQTIGYIPSPPHNLSNPNNC